MSAKNRVVTCRVVTATKELVDRLLAANTKNRSLRTGGVHRLKAGIQAGMWWLTASGVGVDWNGVLLDGQHRLEAIKAAGYPPVQFILVEGLDPLSQAAVDRHAKRSLSDAFSLSMGRPVSKNIIAACNVLLSIKGATRKETAFSSSSALVSDAAITAVLLDWEDDLNAVQAVLGGAIRSSVCAAMAVYYRHQPDQALLLCDQVKRGLGLDEDSPAYRLRAALLAVGRGGNASISLAAFAMSASAICSHARSRPVRRIKSVESWATSPWHPWLADLGEYA